MMITATPGIRIDVDQTIEPDVEAALLARLAQRRGLDGFTAIDEAAWKHPLAVAGFDRALHQDDAPLFVGDDRADRDLRIDVVDEAAAGADEALGLGRLQQPRFERAAARARRTGWPR